MTNLQRETTCQRHKTGWKRKIQRKAFLIGCRTSQLNTRTLEKHVPAHISEGANSDSEASIKVVDKSKSRKHILFTHFLKDRNCDVCLRTKIMRSPCRRRHEGSIPRTEKFGDLLTADHKVLNEEGESRNNHRHSVVVQDLATQWIQSYPCKTKTSQETEKITKIT